MCVYNYIYILYMIGHVDGVVSAVCTYIYIHRHTYVYMYMYMGRENKYRYRFRYITFLLASLRV